MFSPLRIDLKKSLLISVLTLSSLTTSSIVNAENISKDAIILLTNTSRVTIGEVALQENSELTKAANQKAQDMLLKGYFDHYSPNGSTPWNFIINSGYDYSLAGENLAMDFATPQGVHKAWLNSPTHAKNILNPEFTDIGVAVVEGSIKNNSTTLVVQMFGHERSDDRGIYDRPLVKTVSYLLGLEGDTK